MKKADTSSTKPAPNASAPSEQQLKEEEEFQLALALSLSETPAKFSFPDISQFEEEASTVSGTTSVKNIDDDKQDSDYNQQKLAINSYLNTVESNNVKTDDVSTPLSTSMIAKTIQQPIDTNHVKSKQELEVRQLMEEAKSTAEVVINRVHSNRARNRSNDHDSALQTLFLKLTGMRDKLLDYSRNYEEERVLYERLQDKLSEISDARAALDSLREEHQEKKRKDAEEAERQRQSQLALKLGMMREKKSQMMQYHRELALQRIQAQEMMMNQGQSIANNPSVANTATIQSFPQPPTLPDFNPIPITNNQPYPTQVNLGQTLNNSIQESLPGYAIPNVSSQPTYASVNHEPAPSYSVAPVNSQLQQPQQAIGSRSAIASVYPRQAQSNQPTTQHSAAINQVPVTNALPATNFPTYPAQQSSLGSMTNNNNNTWQWSQQQSIQQSIQVPHAVLPKPDDEAPLISFDD